MLLKFITWLKKKSLVHLCSHHTEQDIDPSLPLRGCTVAGIREVPPWGSGDPRDEQQLAVGRSDGRLQMRTCLLVPCSREGCHSELPFGQLVLVPLMDSSCPCLPSILPNSNSMLKSGKIQGGMGCKLPRREIQRGISIVQCCKDPLN